MHKPNREKTWQSCALIAAFVAGVLAAESALVAGEPNCRCEEGGATLLTKMPYIGRLFNDMGVWQAHVGGDGLERIGVDFEIRATCPELCADKCQAKCPVTCAAAECTAATRCIVTTCAKAAAKPCTCPGKCCGANCRCDTTCAVLKECACPGKCCGKSCPCPVANNLMTVCPLPNDSHLWHQIVELTTGNAVLQATLETQEALLHQRSEMLEAFAELEAEKARLEVQAELQAQSEEVNKELLKLAKENLQLKARLELAEAKAEMQLELAKAAAQTEQLKLEIDRLTLRGAEDGAARVSRRAANARKTR